MLITANRIGQKQWINQTTIQTESIATTVAMKNPRCGFALDVAQWSARSVGMRDSIFVLISTNIIGRKLDVCTTAAIDRDIHMWGDFGVGAFLGVFRFCVSRM